MLIRSCRPLLWLWVYVAALPAWSQADTATPAGTVAVVGTSAITVEQLETEMARRAEVSKFVTVEERRQLLEEMIRHRALVAAARQAGYDKDPEVITLVEKLMVSRLLQEQLETRLAEVEVTDEEVAAFYQGRQEEYARPARSQAAIVFFELPEHASAEKRAEIAGRVEQALAEAKALDTSVTHFGTVARTYSDDRASRYRGGVIGWLVEHQSSRYKWDEKVVQAVFALDEPGAIAPVIETDKGFFLVRLVAREESVEQPLRAVADGIRRRLLRDKHERLREAFMDELLSGIEVRINDDLLESITPPVPPDKEPPALPSGR